MMRVLVLAAMLVTSVAVADEGGTSFWLPGNFSSLAAVPTDPGWALPVINYYSSANAGADRTFIRGDRVSAGVRAQGDFLFLSPTYTFATPLAGAQASISVTSAIGYVNASADASLRSPNGAAVAGSQSDSRMGFSDLYPTATLKWNHGVHNFMTYAAAEVPVGTYDKTRLANIGLNHWAIDGGVGYTYFNEKSGNEFSSVLGLTYNFENHATHYRNGNDLHLDLAASHFFLPTFHAGLVGYFYQQLTGDSGSGAILGDFKSRVAGIGPQAGWFFNVGKRKWYANIRGYYEFAAQNRPYGWNLWLTLAIPLSEPAAP
ncbi:transporter [Paraburkholderia sp. J41]|uniref:SphA family protein n=1 Tax=Paraburkholderia sp. J41 TaxID=2805433 RepID=UPI002AC32A53|nr:transporter [Paraburkholderia sp. J41]